MADLNVVAMSESEEMYLVTIAQLLEIGHEEPIPLTQLAEALQVQPVSVNQMVRKMADEGYVGYLPYKGVELRPEGRRRAQHILRHRRVWETFLVEHLHLSISEADALACRMEHITPCEVLQKLYLYLGEPKFSPQGKPIPEVDVDVRLVVTNRLNELMVNQQAEVVGLEIDVAAGEFLKAEGIWPGARVSVLAVGSKGTMLLRVGERQVNVAERIAKGVLIKNPSEVVDES